MFACRDRHEDFLRTFVGSQLNDTDGVVDGLDRTAQIETANYDESTFKAALDEETSGYFVVPKTNLPPGWTAVSSSEGDTVWGKGNVGGPDAGGGGAFGPPPPCKGMAVPSVDLLFVSLGIAVLTDGQVGMFEAQVGDGVGAKVAAGSGCGLLSRHKRSQAREMRL